MIRSHDYDVAYLLPSDHFNAPLRHVTLRGQTRYAVEDRFYGLNPTASIIKVTNKEDSMEPSSLTIHVYRVSTRMGVTMLHVDTYPNTSLAQAMRGYEESYLHDEADGTHIFFIDALSGNVLARRRVTVQKILT